MTHPTTVRRVMIGILVFLMILVSGGMSAQESTPAHIIEALETDGNFSQLLSLIDAAGLTEVFSGGLTFTLFAPTDEALGGLSGFVVEYLTANPDVLERLLTYHAVPGTYTIDDVLAEPILISLEGGILTVNPDIRRINGADLTGDTLLTEKGVIFPIDSVMVPEITLPPVDPFISFDPILTAGSSTVRPLTDRMRDLFLLEGFSGDIVVEETGTNVGLERFCVNAETDIANASRPIRETEIAACLDNDREPIGFFVAVDALAVVVSNQNTFLEDLALEDLARVFTGEYTRWSEIDPTYPDEAIQTYSPGADSGTFVYFTEAAIADGLGVEDDMAEAALMGSATIRFSEDDNVLVSGVESSPYAIGYFGFAYYIANQDRLRTVSINGVVPNEGTAESGAYPLSRPLFIYTSPSVMREKPQVAEFIKFYIDAVRGQLGIDEGQIGYFPVNQDVLNLDRLEWLAAVQGG